MTGHLETLARHVMNLRQRLIFLFRPEIFYIQDIFPDDLFDFIFERGRMGKLAIGVRRQKTGDHRAVEMFWGRIGLRNTDQNHIFPCAREDVPHAVFLDGGRSGNGEFVIRMIRAVSESVHTQLPRVFGRHHRGPGWYRNGGIAGPQWAVRTPLNEGAYIGELILPLVEDEFGGG
jgi:hypothetical protein